MSTEAAHRPSPADIRQKVHAMWSAVAASWGEHVDHTEERAAGVTRTMIDAVAPAPGDHVLELACGAGGLGLALADRVTPGGRVLLSDVSAEMVAIAATRARELADPSTVSATVLDIEQIDLPDDSVDVVVCREGLMFALDPEAALREITRVMRPGGRVSVAVWAAKEHNPWLGVLADAVEERTGTSVPPPGMPGPFALGEKDRLGELLTGAGLESVQVTAQEVPTHDASFEDYWHLRVALAGPLQKRLAALPPQELDAVRDRVRAGLSQYQAADGLRIPGLSYIGTGRLPGGTPGGSTWRSSATDARTLSGCETREVRVASVPWQTTTTTAATTTSRCATPAVTGGPSS